MKKLKEELENAIMERFKQHSIVSALEEELKKNIQRDVKRKYLSFKIKGENNFEYEFYNCQCLIDCEYYNFKPSTIYTRLKFTIMDNQLTRAEKLELKKSKKQFEEGGDFGVDNSIDKTEKILMLDGIIPIDFDEYVKSGINIKFNNIQIAGDIFIIKDIH
jgi:hypothetical protein